MAGKKEKKMVEIISVQTVDADSTKTELTTEADFEKTEKGFKITYDESEATGFEDSRTTITVRGKEFASIQRSGKANSTLIVEKGKKHHCHYGTPYGDLDVGIYTQVIHNELTEEGGRLYLKYTVDINSSYVSDNEIMLTI